MPPEIKQRIEQIRRGEVPEGYKKTKAGVVPVEWEDTLFSDLFIGTSEYTDDLGKYPLYSLTIEEGITAKTERYERSHLVKKENAYKIVRPNDFAYNPMNVRLGAVARHKGDIEVAVSGYYDIFTTRADSDLEFMDSFLISHHMITYYNKVSIGSLVEKQRVHFSQFMDFKLPLPSETERNKIAKVLAAQDKVVALKEKLLQEKTSQKKFLLQELISGKKRIKGFNEQWSNIQLKRYLHEHSVRNSDGTVTNVLSISNRYGFVNQSEQFGKRVASDDISAYKLVTRNCIAYNPSRINVGSIALYKENCPGIISPMYVVFKTGTDLLPEYLIELTKTHHFYQKMKNLLSGSVRDSLKFSDLCHISLKIPSTMEQKAILKIVSEAEKEILLLQQDLDQEKQKKKALMQLLLTGIVRVNV